MRPDRESGDEAGEHAATCPRERMPDMRPDRFDGDTVLVTGSSRGIGAATAKAFAAEGALVAVNYRRDADGAISTRQAIIDAGGTAEVFQADIGREDDVDRLAREVEAALGPVSILVNNAALIDRSSMFDLSLNGLRHRVAGQRAGAVPC